MTSEQVAETAYVGAVLDDDRVYALAVSVLGEQAALPLLGRRPHEGPPEEQEEAH